MCRSIRFICYNIAVYACPGQAGRVVWRLSIALWKASAGAVDWLQNVSETRRQETHTRPLRAKGQARWLRLPWLSALAKNSITQPEASPDLRWLPYWITRY